MTKKSKMAEHRQDMRDQFGLRKDVNVLLKGVESIIGEKWILTTLKNVFSTMRPANASSLRATKSIATAPPID